MIEGRKCYINEGGQALHTQWQCWCEEGRAFTLTELAELKKECMVEGAKMARKYHYMHIEDLARRIVEGK